MLIDKRISEGLSLLRKYYTVEKCESDKTISSPRVCGRLHEAVRYDIKGVGNLLTMTCKETEENNLSSFVIMPYKKNLPLFSSDFVYSGENRYFLLEIYDLSVRHDELFDKGIEDFAKLGEKLTELKDIPTQPCWYDDIRPVCYSKAPALDQDEMAIRAFLDIHQNLPCSLYIRISDIFSYSAGLSFRISSSCFRTAFQKFFGTSYWLKCPECCSPWIISNR